MRTGRSAAVPSDPGTCLFRVYFGAVRWFGRYLQEDGEVERAVFLSNKVIAFADKGIGSAGDIPAELFSAGIFYMYIVLPLPEPVCRDRMSLDFSGQGQV